MFSHCVQPCPWPHCLISPSRTGQKPHSSACSMAQGPCWGEPSPPHPSSSTHSLSASWSWGWRSLLPSAAGEWPRSAVCPWGSRCWLLRSGLRRGWLRFCREKAQSGTPEKQFLQNSSGEQDIRLSLEGINSQHAKICLCSLLVHSMPVTSSSPHTRNLDPPQLPCAQTHKYTWEPMPSSNPKPLRNWECRPA